MAKIPGPKRVWVSKHTLGMQYFCFYYAFETNFSGHNKIRGALPPNAHRGYGLR